MKISLLTLLLSLTFLGCNANTAKSINSEAHQQASNQTGKFPTVKRPANNVNCRNCYATFKLSMATKKQSHGHNYIACPVCNKNYLKKSK